MGDEPVIAPVAGLRLRPAGEQATASGDGWTSRRVFAFGDDYDPAWSGVGPLVALNVEDLEPGRGFAPHDHAGVEIVTLVVNGTVEHETADGGVVRAAAGTVLVVDATAGLRHAERSAPGARARTVTAWLVPPAAVDIPTTGVRRRLVAVAAMTKPLCAPLLRTPGVALSYVRVRKGTPLRLPPPPARVALLALRGSVTVGQTPVGCGDAVVLDELVEDLPARAGPDGADIVAWTLPPP